MTDQQRTPDATADDDEPCLTMEDLKQALAEDDRKVKKRLALCRVLHYLSEFGATVLRGDSPLGDEIVEQAYARAVIRVMDRLSRPL